MTRQHIKLPTKNAVIFTNPSYKQCYNQNMSNLLIGFLLGAGVSAWVYSKMMNRTGNNSNQAITTAAVAGLIALLVTVSLLSLIPE